MAASTCAHQLQDVIYRICNACCVIENIVCKVIRQTRGLHYFIVHFRTIVLIIEQDSFHNVPVTLNHSTVKHIKRLILEFLFFTGMAGNNERRYISSYLSVLLPTIGIRYLFM